MKISKVVKILFTNLLLQESDTNQNTGLYLKLTIRQKNCGVKTLIYQICSDIVSLEIWSKDFLVLISKKEKCYPESIRDTKYNVYYCFIVENNPICFKYKYAETKSKDFFNVAEHVSLLLTLKYPKVFSCHKLLMKSPNLKTGKLKKCFLRHKRIFFNSKGFLIFHYKKNFRVHFT